MASRLFFIACLFVLMPAFASHYPYFSSIGANRANVRTGPGLDYPVLWVYTQRTLPVEVLALSDSWIRIRDYEGLEGWISNNLLKSRPRYVMLLQPQPLFSRSDSRSTVLATMDRGVLARVVHCSLQWCKISVGRRQGYVEKPTLWGVYPNELLP